MNPRQEVSGHLRTRARVHRVRGWRPAVRRIEVDATGAWRWQHRDGQWAGTSPDVVAVGPFGLWVHVAGPRADAARGASRRVAATVWRAC
ncbi:hypothetical protein IMZ29_21030, partial [Achromobacter sp. GG226]|uniref:hypothetical protein n=1 Tax=Verticiella alkaliphila TaxID=2779529 RepID=UPI001C0C0A4A